MSEEKAELRVAGRAGSCQRRAPGSFSWPDSELESPADFARGQRAVLELPELQGSLFCRSTCNARPGALSNSGNASHSDSSGALCSSSIPLSLCQPAAPDPEAGIWVSQFFLWVGVTGGRGRSGAASDPALPAVIERGHRCCFWLLITIYNPYHIPPSPYSPGSIENCRQLFKRNCCLTVPKEG